jgi:predicted secreted Zn-dependent protease
MVLKRILFILALTLAFSTACRAEVTENMVVNYYTADVGGQALGDALVAAYPLQSTGEHAHTDWHIDWHFETMSAGGDRCRISSVATSLKITMTMPQITDASPEVQAKFDAYLPKLRMHEDGHADNGRHAAASIDAAIAAIQNKPCDTIVQDANDAADAILQAAQQADVDYDDRTEHGRTQGAWLE